MPWFWHAGPDSYPGLHPGLLARGAAEAAVMPLMTVPLDRVTAPEGPPGLVISELADPAGLGEWVRCYGPSFGIPLEAAGAVEQVEATRPDPPGSYVRLAGRDRGLRTGILQATRDGEPVYRRMGFTTVGEYRLMQLPARQPER